MENVNKIQQRITIALFKVKTKNEINYTTQKTATLELLDQHNTI